MVLVLRSHTDHAPRLSLFVKGAVARRPGSSEALITFKAHGDIAQVLWPDASSEGRTDRLWEHSCFEAFIAPSSGQGYLELNFAPGKQWAAYRFDRYRDGMRDDQEVEIAKIVWCVRNLSVPRVEMHVRVKLPARFEEVEWRLGLSAIIEARDGSKSYWALAHAPGKPDFHNADCFVARLAAPERA